MLNDLKEIIAIKSLKSQPEINAPYGKGCKDALDWFLKKAESYGLLTQNIDNRAGYAEYGGGSECIGVLCHLDVVPEGTGWNSPPYELTVLNNKLYGRGVVDNKGPLVVILHALKKLKQDNIKLSKRIRLIAGCDEENGSTCIKHYVQTQEMPQMSFVPDAEFPVIYSEKGILQFELICEKDADFDKNLLYIKGGTRANIVADFAEIAIKKPSPLYDYLLTLSNQNAIDNSLLLNTPIIENLVGGGYELNAFDIKEFKDKIIITANGEAAHASRPNEGENALWKIFSLLNAFKERFKAPKLNLLYDKLCNNLSAQKLEIYSQDKNSGDLTINFGQFETTQKDYKITLDLRLPLSTSKDFILNKIISFIDGKTEILNFSSNLFIEPQSPLITTLFNIYKRHFNDKAQPIISGGGTYARQLKNAAAFGPALPNVPTNIHMSNEFISIEHFNKLFDVYYDAIIELAK